MARRSQSPKPGILGILPGKYLTLLGIARAGRYDYPEIPVYRYDLTYRV